MERLFQTQRLWVRKFQADDYEDVAEILTDKEVTYFEPYETFSKEACVQEAINFSESKEFFAVVLENKVIGKIYFSDRNFGSYEIGYTFHGQYQGNGYAYESVNAMIQYAFSTMGVRRIFAEVNARNDKSVRLLEKLGMRKEAIHKELFPRKEDVAVYDDFYVYAILANEVSKKC